MVNVRRYNEIVFVLYKRQKRGENLGFRDIFIAVYQNITAPIRPKFAAVFKGIKPARIHIVKAVFFFEIGEIIRKASARIFKARGGGKPCSRSDNDRVRFVNFLF